MPTFEEQLIREFRQWWRNFYLENGETMPNKFESFLLEKTRQVRETTLKEVGEIVEGKKKKYPYNNCMHGTSQICENCIEKIGYNQACSDLQKIIKGELHKSKEKQ